MVYPVEVSGNRTFMLNFESWQRGMKFDKSEKVSTISKQSGHIGYYKDSFLQFMSLKDTSFRLQNLLELATEQFVELCDPRDWVLQVKDRPSNSIEQLKAWARLADFIRERLEDIDVSKDLPLLTKRDHVVRRIVNLVERVKASKIMAKFKRLEKQQRKEVEKAKVILNPSTFFNEEHAIVAWFNSPEAVESQKEFDLVWNKRDDGMKDLEFTRAAGFARFMVFLDSKNRRGALNFSNKDFRQRVEKWFPDACEEVTLFPENWDANVPSVPGKPPSCYVIQLSGNEEGLKKGEGVDIVLTRRSHDICIKYQEMKEKKFSSYSDDDNFFCNSKGKPLAPMNNSKGSMLYKFGKVTGISKFTTNSLRRGTDAKLQRNSTLKAHMQQIQSHSNSVSIEYYDKSASNVRASVMNQFSEKESPYKGDLSVTDDIVAKRGAKRKLEMEMNVEKARSVLAKRKMKPNIKLGKSCKVLPADREYLQRLFTNPDLVEVSNAIKNGFPGTICYVLV